MFHSRTRYKLNFTYKLNRRFLFVTFLTSKSKIFLLNCTTMIELVLESFKISFENIVLKFTFGQHLFLRKDLKINSANWLIVPFQMICFRAYSAFGFFPSSLNKSKMKNCHCHCQARTAADSVKFHIKNMSFNLLIYKSITRLQYKFIL